MLHVLNHAFFKCQLFYAAGCVYQIKHVVDMERLGGLFKLMPVTAACFVIGGVAISALPPFNGFASEFMIYSGLFSNASMTIWAKLMLGVVAALLAFVGAVSALSRSDSISMAVRLRCRPVVTASSKAPAMPFKPSCPKTSIISCRCMGAS